MSETLKELEKWAKESLQAISEKLGPKEEFLHTILAIGEAENYVVVVQSAFSNGRPDDLDLRLLFTMTFNRSRADGACLVSPCWARSVKIEGLSEEDVKREMNRKVSSCDDRQDMLTLILSDGQITKLIAADVKRGSGHPVIGEWQEMPGAEGRMPRIFGSCLRVSKLYRKAGSN